MTTQREEFINNLFISNYLPLKRYICHLMNDSESADDIIQETFLIAIAKIHALEYHENPVGWLYKTAYNLSLQTCHKHKEYLVDDIEMYTTPYVDDMFEELEPYPVLSQLLTEANLSLLYEHHVAGYTYNELAKREHVSQSAMKMRFSRLANKIKNIF